MPVLCRCSRSRSRSSTSGSGTPTAGESSSASFFRASSLLGINAPSASTTMRSIVRMSQSRMVHPHPRPGSTRCFRSALLGSLLQHFGGALHAPSRLDLEIRNSRRRRFAHGLSAADFGLGGALGGADLTLELAQHYVHR